MVGRAKSAPFVSKKGESAADVADRLLAEDQYLTDHSDTVYQYNGAFWEELSRARLRQLALFADGYKRSSDKRRREIVDQLKARSHMPDLKWGRVADYEVPCK